MKTKPDEFLFSFADRFLQDHAGFIISDPRIAMVELMSYGN